MHSCEAVGKNACITRAGTGKNYSGYTITQCQSRTCNFRTGSL